MRVTVDQRDPMDSAPEEPVRIVAYAAEEERLELGVSFCDCGMATGFDYSEHLDHRHADASARF
jgi:hypothetical protein